MTKSWFVALSVSIVIVGLVLALAMAQGNRWDCLAEDEVVVIDGTCRHLDTLR